MAVAVGSRLSQYELTALIGEGGMGRVFKGHDTKLGRSVAVKVLPDALATDSERIARFEREAKMLASLNHPNIASLIGMDHAEGVHFIVMELIEGETIADRLQLGPIPEKESLAIAMQIAEALEAAHERGVVHRDLKPANIKLTTDGKVKVLDFGLAKAMSPEAGSEADVRAANSPTLSMMATQGGVILGTASYMSPEQSAGRPVDKRSDIWAFGAVLFEMLSGQQAFKGETVSHILASVLKDEPDWTLLPAQTPPLIRRLLRRCLEKDRKKRLADAADARLDLHEALTSSGTEHSTSAPTSNRWIAVAAALAVTTLISSSLFVYDRFADRPADVNLRPASVVALSFPGLAVVSSVAISPDGRRIVVAARRTATGADRMRLYVRELDQLESREIPGTQGPEEPFFSPDGRWIGFFDAGFLKKVSVDGGAPTILAEVPDSLSAAGGSWGADQSILFARGDGLWRVSANGGAPVAVTAAGSQWRALPRHVPGNSGFLFAQGAMNQVSPGGVQRLAADQEIAIQRAGGQQPQVVLKGPALAEYSSTGHLVYAESNALFAAPFDIDRAALTGPPTPIADKVNARAFGTSFGLSAVNSLVYLPSAVARPLELVWVDRSGKVQATGAPARAFGLPRLSGTRVAVTITGDDQRVPQSAWIYDLERNTLGRLSQTPASWAIWSPDGTRLAFENLSPGGSAFVIKAADGSGGETLLDAPGSNPSLQSWSADGRTLLYQITGDNTKRDLWTITIDGDRKASPYAQTRFFEGGGAFSPDGKMVAWVSQETMQETGAAQVYVQAYPPTGGKVQVSPNGGSEPVWSRSGKELFYRLGDKMMSVSVSATPSLVVGKPVVLFEGRFELFGGARPNYDVSPDGKRFLMLRPVESAIDDARVIYVSEWPQLLKNR